MEMGALSMTQMSHLNKIGMQMRKDQQCECAEQKKKVKSVT